MIVFPHGHFRGCGLRRYRCGYSPFCSIFYKIICRKEVMSMSDYEILIIILRMIDIICDILIEYHKNNCAHKNQWTQYKQKFLSKRSITDYRCALYIYIIFNSKAGVNGNEFPIGHLLYSYILSLAKFYSQNPAKKQLLKLIDKSIIANKPPEKSR